MSKKLSVEHLAKMKAAREASRDTPVERKNHHEKWLENDTRKTAVNAFCMDCMGGVSTPGVRADVAKCPSGPDSSQPCTLYAWRPYKDHSKAEEEDGEELL